MSEEAAEVPCGISIVIPTFDRGPVLIATLENLLRIAPATAQCIVVDQTPRHEVDVESRLAAWDHENTICWLRLPRPSIPLAMNAGLEAAQSALVLFLDDDIIPSPGLVEAHCQAHADSQETWAVVGQVLQPGEVPTPIDVRARVIGLRADLDFPFHSTQRSRISNVMAGNLSVKRDRALQVGGFDENFQGAAYRFETEFCRRLITARGRVLFEPAASIRHLRAPRGGTRSHGSHLTSASAAHGMGDYYFALRSGLSLESVAYILRRPLREIGTRFHLWHPWYIPVKLLGEIRAFWAAVRACARGPQLVNVQPLMGRIEDSCPSGSAS